MPTTVILPTAIRIDYPGSRSYNRPMSPADHPAGPNAGPNAGPSPGPDGFLSTRWSVVLDVGGEDPARVREALETLCSTYWFPLYSFVRRRGVDAEEAQDVTQGF